MRSWLRALLIVLMAHGLGPATAGAQAGAAARARASVAEPGRSTRRADSAVGRPRAPRPLTAPVPQRTLQRRARSSGAPDPRLVARRPALRVGGRLERTAFPDRGLPHPDRVRMQLERSREMLDLSGPRIGACGDGRARATLRSAVEMQGRALRAEQSGRMLGALQLTMGARERCLLALRQCRLQEDVQQAAGHALSRTAELLARAAEPDARGRELPPTARETLVRANALQDDAVRRFQDGRYEASLELTLTARRLAHRALGRGLRNR